MDIDRLSISEINYELAIRGIKPEGVLDNLRKLLRAASKREKSDKYYEPPVYPFSFAEDQDAIVAGLKSLGELIDEFEDSVHGGTYKKINTKISHYGGRIDRMISKGSDEEKLKQNLVTNLESLKTKLEQKLQDFETSLVALSINVGGSENPVIQQTSTPNRPDRRCALFSHASGEVKPIPVCKWGLKFSGEQDEMSLSAFLERVEELRVARNISLEVLFDSALDLFLGKALLWYRAYRGVVNSWDDLKKLLREEFQPHNYDEKLLEEIKRRTQGPNESIGVYVAVIQSMFKRMNVSVPENFKLKILMRNIAPFFQDKLSLVTVDSVSELLKLGKKIEARKVDLEEFVPPPRKVAGRTLEPDLAYVYAERGPSTSRHIDSTTVSGIKCWNCELVGHVAARCPKPLNKRCFKCGKVGVTVNTCSSCKNQGNARRGR